MTGLLYRLRMARAGRVWEAARRADRRVHTETGAYAECFRHMAMRLTRKAHAIEIRARKGRLPG